MWSPQENWDTNLIDSQLVETVLKADVQVPERQLENIQFGAKALRFQGHIDLEWGFENSTDIYKTRFMVVALEEATFDVVLGRKSAGEYGLL